MLEPKTQSEVIFFLLCNISKLDDEHFAALMDKLEQWDIGRKREILLSDAYEILKQNVRYSSGDCEGFVYLSQIEELLK
ncbi:hypothetical protein [Flavobacterium sp.]|jgi:hypothetical protein|uniref:hypothetical protein n=1 Tax=Flavobacterium sp. TaxID=239 RepID=UPI0037BF46B9